MGYRIVAVSPLKPFPIAYFGLANVVSLDDAKKQIEKKFAEAVLAELKANTALQELGAKVEEAHDWLEHLGKKSMTDAIKEEIEKAKEEIAELESARKEIADPIREKHKKAGEKEIALLEERWAEGKIQPALDLHLARQARRKKHFESACRLEGCDNPHRQKRARGLERGTKANRPGAKPLFCGAHAYLRRSISAKAKKELIANSSKRLVVS